MDKGETARGIVVMYMNAGRSADATHKYLERYARGDVAVVFVDECWVEKKSVVGTQLHPNYVRLGCVSEGGRVACHVWRDLVNFCLLVGCENRFVCVEIGGVHIGGCIVSVGRGCMKCSSG